MGRKVQVGWIQVGGKTLAEYKSVGRHGLGTVRWEVTGWVQVDGKKRTGYKSEGRRGLATSR